MRYGLLALCLATTALSSGCGTVCNFAGAWTRPDIEPRVYGGVIRDLETFDELLDKNTPLFPASSSGDGRGALLGYGAICGFLLVEPVASLVADTATLPLTIYLEHRRTAARISND
jgi:hypothetical protein